MTDYSHDRLLLWCYSFAQFPPRLVFRSDTSLIWHFREFPSVNTVILPIHCLLRRRSSTQIFTLCLGSTCLTSRNQSYIAIFYLPVVLPHLCITTGLLFRYYITGWLDTTHTRTNTHTYIRVPFEPFIFCLIAVLFLSHMYIIAFTLLRAA